MKNTMRGRVREALRYYALVPAALITLAAIVFARFSWGWIAILVTAVGVIAAAWNLADHTAYRSVSDLANLIKALDTFNSGVRSVRARGASTKEMRQLVDGFNKMATEAERAITALSAEERRQMQFVSDVSHELKTPLTAIRGAAETLLNGGLTQAEQSRFLANIATESERLTRLANDLLTLRRIEGATGEIPLRTFNLLEAAEQAREMLAPLFEARGVEFEITGFAPDILGDKDRIMQVIANLVDNATRMVGENGKVWIEFSSAWRQELSSHTAAKSFVDIDRFSIMTINDNGPGIPEDNLAHIFDRFYRTEPSRARNYGGSGLGLSIVRAIIVAHGGTIEVENRPGGGAQFTIYLPVPPDFDYDSPKSAFL